MGHSSNIRIGKTLAALLLTSVLSACASIPDDQRSENDPWESLNRSIFSVNRAVDNVTLKPLAKGYQKILPGPVSKGVTNFSRNLFTPRSVVNNVLQGKPVYAFTELARFLYNSTLGIGGLIDVATIGGIEEHREDFGQTAAVWGVPAGPYVTLPFLGPATLSDAVMLPFDIAADPLYHYDNSSVRDKLYILRLIDVRERLFKAEKLMADSKDPYITLRESYLQNREYEIYDGDPPEDDEFFDEFLEEDDE